MDIASSNSENSGNTKKSFREYWGIDDLGIRDPYLGGFTQIPNLVLCYLNELGIGGSKSSPAILLLYLISRDFKRVSYCFPSHAQMARDLKTSPGTIGRNLKSLQRLGLIEIKHTTSERGQTTNCYTWDGLMKKLKNIVLSKENLRK